MVRPGAGKGPVHMMGMLILERLPYEAQDSDDDEMVELSEWKRALEEQGGGASKRARVDPSLDGEDDWFDTVDGDYVAAGEDADADDDDEEEDDQIVELAV